MRALVELERLLDLPKLAETGGDLLLRERESARLRIARQELEGALQENDRAVGEAERSLAETRQRSDAVAGLHAEAMARLARERVRRSDEDLADTVAVRAYTARSRRPGQVSSDG
ncbi:MAG: hypothetical protein AAF968_04140 [Pseudomonadota bacterium]